MCLLLTRLAFPGCSFARPSSVSPHMSGMSINYFVRAMELFSVNLDRVLVKKDGALNAVRGKGE